MQKPEFRLVVFLFIQGALLLEVSSRIIGIKLLHGWRID